MIIASELARYGIRCRVVDKRPGPIDVTHACVLWTRTQEVLSAMGIRAAWLPHSLLLREMNVYGFGKRLGAIEYEGLDSPYPHPLLVGQNITERILIEHLATQGITVERPVEAINMQHDTNGVMVTLQHEDGHEEQVQANWLIACEGSKSMVRETLGIPFEGERYERYEFVQADCGIRWSRPRNRGYYFLTEGKFLATLPLPLPISDPDRIRVFIARPIVDPADRSDPTLEEIQALMRESVAEDVELSNPIWLSRVRVQRRLAAQYRQGRVFLAGDTAHVHVPMGGQGMNTGMQDGFNLAWKLAYVIKDLAHESLLDSYQPERRPVAEQLLKGTDLTFRAFSEPGALLRTAIQVAGPLAFRTTIPQRQAVRVLSEIDINYKHTLFVEEHTLKGGPEAGERAPDATTVTLPTKETTTLFERIYGTNWHVLLLSGEEPSTETLQQLQNCAQAVADTYNHIVIPHLVIARTVPPHNLSWQGSTLMDSELLIHEKYGKGASIYLIRPDGYIGFRAPLAQREQLLNYLGRILKGAKDTASVLPSP
jgi:3-(3-hydroxy-phenyl)propionate hydroxylase